MKLQDALKLHPEDEVIVKKTGQPLLVLETTRVKSGDKIYTSLLLSDGNWYGYKEIKRKE